MKEKLTELIKKAEKEFSFSNRPVLDIEEFIADYLLANGVIVPPCKAGDTVWFLARSLHTKIEKVKSGKVVRMAITENGIDLFVDNWTAKLPYGKRAFLTKEEAEQALAERSVDNA